MRIKLQILLYAFSFFAVCSTAQEWDTVNYEIIRNAKYYEVEVDPFTIRQSLTFDSISNLYSLKTIHPNSEKIDETFFDLKNKKAYIFKENGSKYFYTYIDDKQLIPETTFKRYDIYKFGDFNGIIDGESLFFFCPDFGIICSKSTTWYNYSKMTDIKGKNKKETLNFLRELIFWDNVFLHKFKSQKYYDSIRYEAPYLEEKRKLDSLINMDRKRMEKEIEKKIKNNR